MLDLCEGGVLVWGGIGGGVERGKGYREGGDIGKGGRERGRGRGKGDKPSVFLRTRSMAREQPVQVIVMLNL